MLESNSRAKISKCKCTKTYLDPWTSHVCTAHVLWQVSFFFQWIYVTVLYCPPLIESADVEMYIWRATVELYLYFQYPYLAPTLYEGQFYMHVRTNKWFKLEIWRNSARCVCVCVCVCARALHTYSCNLPFGVSIMTPRLDYSYIENSLQRTNKVLIISI